MKMHELDDIGAEYWAWESRFGYSAWAGNQILGRYPSLDEAKAACERHKADAAKRFTAIQVARAFAENEEQARKIAAILEPSAKAFDAVTLAGNRAELFILDFIEAQNIDVIKSSQALRPFGIFHVTAPKIERGKVSGKSNAQLARERFDSKAWGVRR